MEQDFWSGWLMGHTVCTPTCEATQVGDSVWEEVIRFRLRRNRSWIPLAPPNLILYVLATVCRPFFWTRLFLEAQGYDVTDNIIYQDKKIAILLEKNSKSTSGKCTKHINMQYFFVTDCIHKGDVSFEWCPTGDMTGDFLTKPNQGALFKSFRDVLMSIVEHPDPGPGNPKVSMKKGVKLFFVKYFGHSAQLGAAGL